MSSDARKKFFYKWDAISIMCTLHRDFSRIFSWSSFICAENICTYRSMLCFGLVMLGDWYMQYIDVLPSTNIRRFITGTLCGIGYLQILIKIFYMVAKMV